MNMNRINQTAKIDTDTLAFDGTDNPATTTEKQWYTFPTNTVSLAAGEHTIRIVIK